MSQPDSPLDHRRIQAVIVAAVAVTMSTIEYKSNHGTWWQNVPIALLYTLVIWEGNYQLLTRMRRRFPRPDDTPRRLLWQVPGHVLYTLVAGSVTTWALALVVPSFVCSAGTLWDGFKLNMMPTVLVVLIYEAAFFYQQWKMNLLRVEALARTTAQNQLDALRQQLDPHFLFNSLNTLAALIDEEPAAAQHYLSQLADVYRYVLLAREQETVSLDEELTFVDAYLHLNQIRFRENLRVQNTIAPAARPRRVAPLSVQTLVENALKHNVVSREHPLAIRLESAGPDAIRVANSVRPKAQLAPSTRTGLRNLISRYALLTERPVQVWAGEKEFSVELPLM